MVQHAGGTKVSPSSLSSSFSMPYNQCIYSSQILLEIFYVFIPHTHMYISTFFFYRNGSMLTHCSTLYNRICIMLWSLFCFFLYIFRNTVISEMSEMRIRVPSSLFYYCHPEPLLAYCNGFPKWPASLSSHPIKLVQDTTSSINIEHPSSTQEWDIL